MPITGAATLHNIDLVKRFNGPLVIDDVTQVRPEAVLQYVDYQLSTLPLLDENDPNYEDRLDSRLMWELLHLFVSKKDAGVVVTPSEIGRLLISHDKQPQSSRNRQKFYDYLFVDHTYIDDKHEIEDLRKEVYELKKRLGNDSSEHEQTLKGRSQEKRLIKEEPKTPIVILSAPALHYS